MRIDPSLSKYSASPSARDDFSREDLRRCKMLLRRLQFLESKVEESGGLGSAEDSGGAAFAEWEMDALEWILTKSGFLVVDEKIEQDRQRNRQENAR